MPVIACPKPSELKDYLSGRLEPAEIDEIDAHLSACSACEQAIDRLEDEPDTLVGLLQSEETDAEVSSASSPVGDISTNSAAEVGQVETGEVASYQLIRRLGSGGMGRVYLARHKKLDKEVAIKILPRLAGYEQEFVARFEREMRAAGQLEHPAIVRTTDAGEHDGVHYLVMDVIDGLDLSRVASAMGRLNIADACEVVRQAASGLSHAHELGIVHRDVKPSNLMLDTQGCVRILDFGLAQMDLWEKGSAEITTVGQLMGTLDYMAPEQAERRGAVDYRADLYALGATLFRLIAGRAPLAAAPDLTPLEKLRLLSTHSAPKLSTLRSDVPEDLDRLVCSMLDRDPSLRPASASHVAEALEPFARSDSLAPLLEKARHEKQSGASSLPAEMMSVLPTLAPGAERGSSRGRGFFWPAIACSMAGILALAGILFVIETTKGQLVIDSKDASVSVKLRKDGKVARELTIEPGRQSTKLWGGKYEIEIDSPSDRFTVSHDTFSILRGEIVIATIQPKRPDATADKPTVAPAAVDVVETDERLNEVVYEGETLDTWLRRLKFEKSVEQQRIALSAILALAEPGLKDIVDPAMYGFVAKASESTTEESWMGVLQILCATSDGNLLAHKQLFYAPLPEHAYPSWARVLYGQQLFQQLDGESRTFILEWLLDRKGSGPRTSVYFWSLLDSMVRVNQDDAQVESYMEQISKAESRDVILQQRLLDEFWLWDVVPRPQDGYQVENARFQNFALSHAIEQLNGPADVKIRVRSWLLIAKFAQQQVVFNDKQRRGIGKALAQLFDRSARTWGWSDPKVLIRDGSGRAAFTRNSVQMVHNLSEREIDVALQVLTKVELLEYCRPEIEGFQNRLMDSPIHIATARGDLLTRVEQGKTRSEHGGQAEYFVRSGQILGVENSEMLSRFQEVRESDRQNYARQAITELNAGTLSSLALEHLSKKEGQEAVDAVMRYLSYSAGAYKDVRALDVLLNLTGKEFLSKFVEVLEQSADISSCGRLSHLPNFSCNSLVELRPLLEWSSRKFASNIPASEKLKIAVLLRDLCRDRQFPKRSTTLPPSELLNGLVSSECQRAVVDLLVQQQELEDQAFWLNFPVFGVDEEGEIEYRYDEAWQQEVAKRTIAILENSESRSLRIQALACFRSVLGTGGKITAEQKDVLVRCLVSRVEEALVDIDSACKVDRLKNWFGPWVVPGIDSAKIIYRAAGSKEVVASEVVVTLQAIKELGIQDALPSSLLAELVDRMSRRVGRSRAFVGSSLEWARLVNPEDLAHLIVVMAGEMLGRDVSDLLLLPQANFSKSKLKAFNQVQSGDTLAIYIESVLPMDKQPLPVMQAGKNSPVVGYPVPVHASGEIVLPLIGRLKVTGMDVLLVQTLIGDTYVAKNILVKPILSVEMLAKASSEVEIRALSSSAPPASKADE